MSKKSSLSGCLPGGWGIERESAAACVLHWGKAARPGRRPGILIPPSARLEFEIRFSDHGWMWADRYWRDSEYGGARALEKWRRFAATPAAAALGAAREVLDLLREDNTRSPDARAMRAAAINLIDAIEQGPALDQAPQPAAAWPLADQAGRPEGYYRVAVVPDHAESVNEVVWWSGERWLNVRPGCAPGACINRDRTEPLSTWPRAVVWPLEQPVAPEESRQFEAWACGPALEIAAPQGLSAQVEHGVQMGLF